MTLLQILGLSLAILCAGSIALAFVAARVGAKWEDFRHGIDDLFGEPRDQPGRHRRDVA